MKSFLNLRIAIAITLTSFVVPAFAQTPSLPSQSQGVSIGDAIRTASESMAYVNVPGQLASTSNPGRVFPPGQGSVAVLANCRFTGLSVSTVTPDNEVTVQVAVSNTRGRIVLEGYTRTRPTQVNGVWTLPKEAADVVLTVPWMVYFEMESDVESSYLVVPQSGGGEQWYRLYVDGRDVGFARDSLGLRGGAYIRTNYKNGKTDTMLVETGAKIIASTIMASTNPTIKHLVPFENISMDKPGEVRIQTSRGVGISPSIEIKQAAAGSVLLKVSTSEGKTPTGFRIIRPDGQMTVTPGIPTNGGHLIPLQAGISYVIAMFKAGDCDEPAVPVKTGNDGEGGKS